MDSGRARPGHEDEQGRARVFLVRCVPSPPPLPSSSLSSIRDADIARPSTGAHSCIGKALAYHEMRYVLARLEEAGLGVKESMRRGGGCGVEESLGKRWREIQSAGSV